MKNLIFFVFEYSSASLGNLRFKKVKLYLKFGIPDLKSDFKRNSTQLSPERLILYFFLNFDFVQF